MSASRCRSECRVVDARYLAPDIPAETPPQFAVDGGARVVPVNDLVAAGGGTEPVRRGGLGQDRDGRLRLAPDARRRPRRDLLGATARPVDAGPGPDPAGPRDLPRHGRRPDAGGRRRPVAAGPVPPARGRRHHAAHRPLGHPDDGEGTDAGPVGARRCCARSRTSYASGTSARCGGEGSSLDGRLGHGRGRCAGRELCGRRPEACGRGCPSGQPASITLQPIRAGFPCFGARPDRVRRGDPRRRRREEPAVPAVVVRQLA